MKKTNAFLTIVALAAITSASTAQNAKIKCYFNHAVNAAVSTGTTAKYLNGTAADTIAAYINRAKYTIDIAQYDYTAGSSTHDKDIATAINNAIARGVRIRWIYNGSSPNSGLSLINWGTKAHKLASPIQSGYIMHNKFMVIDVNSTNANDAITWTGSFDWSDEQCKSDYNNMVIVYDKNVSLAYYHEFNKMWGGTGSAPTVSNEKWGTAKTASTTTSFTVNGTPIQVYFSPKDSPETHLINSINSADHEMAFGIYTFTDNTVASAIKTKHTGGVSVFGIMDKYSATYTPYSTLSSALGSHLKEYTGSYIYHNKVMLVDYSHPTSDPQVFTGSYNWTSAASNSNDEGMMVIHDAVVANQYYQSLCRNFTDVGGSSTVCPTSTTRQEGFDFGEDQFAVYPHPAVNELNIQVKNAGETLNVKIYDSLGNLVKEKQVFETDNLQMDIADLLTGVYVVIVDKGDSRYAKKILKQ